ncbi:MAG TPA: hypothetical protein VKE96_09095 [Vicinamibacterales bacterium]|nr:hypothetical protein [Vicinamibacterales bacterium]
MGHKEIMVRVCGAVKRTLPRICGAAAIVGACGCGSSTTRPSTPTSTSAPSALRADVTDPIGDTPSDARVPVAPDLVRATAAVDGGNLTLVVSFAPGTFNRQTTRVAVLFDTDQNPATGIRQQDGLGADFGLDLFPGGGLATITRADEAGCAARQSCFVNVGSASMTILTDGMQAVVPLGAIGAASGRLGFVVNSYVLVAPLTPVVFDYLPDITLAPARVQ